MHVLVHVRVHVHVHWLAGLPVSTGARVLLAILHNLQVEYAPEGEAAQSGISSQIDALLPVKDMYQLDIHLKWDTQCSCRCSSSMGTFHTTHTHKAGGT